jgi:hypothetical protein
MAAKDTLPSIHFEPSMLQATCKALLILGLLAALEKVKPLATQITS